MGRFARAAAIFGAVYLSTFGLLIVFSWFAPSFYLGTLTSGRRYHYYYYNSNIPPALVSQNAYLILAVVAVCVTLYILFRKSPQVSEN